jgi:hypothetical protein
MSFGGRGERRWPKRREACAFPFLPSLSLPLFSSQTCQHRTICETHPPASRLTNWIDSNRCSSRSYIDTAATTVPSALPRHQDLTGSDNDNDDDKSDGEIFEELEAEEEDFDWGGFREKRMEQLKAEWALPSAPSFLLLREHILTGSGPGYSADAMKLAQNTLHGKYTEIRNEKELIMTAS